jgi:hypothetical protein
MHRAVHALAISFVAMLLHRVDIEYQCMSSELGLSHPSTPSECASSGTKGGWAHSPAGEGVGESQFRRLRKSLALCQLCGLLYLLI